MATITFFIALILTLSFTTIHARDSQFFAKVSNNVPQETQPLNTNQQDTNVVPQTKDVEGGGYGLFGHESGQLPPSATTTTTTTTNNDNNNNYLPANLPENYNPVAYTTPIHSSTQDIPNEFNMPQDEFNGGSTLYNPDKQDEFMQTNDNNMYNSGKQEIGTNGGNMYNSGKQEYGTNGGNIDNSGKQEYGTNGGDMYNSGKQEYGTNGGDMYNSGKQEYGTNGDNMYNYEKQGMSDTRFLENGKYYYAGHNMYNSQKHDFEGARFVDTQSGNMYNKKQGVNGMYNRQMYNSRQQGSNMYHPEKQGMSDTRFLENGKYYYDLNNENNLNMNSRGVRNGYETQGYYGNNDNSYDRYNSNGGYQNQEEFQVNQDNQYDP